MLAVKAGEVATPTLFVVTEPKLANVPVAPVFGSVKVTESPGTVFPYASFARTCRDLTNAAPTVAD